MPMNAEKDRSHRRPVAYYAILSLNRVQDSQVTPHQKHNVLRHIEASHKKIFKQLLEHHPRKNSSSQNDDGETILVIFENHNNFNARLARA